MDDILVYLKDNTQIFDNELTHAYVRIKDDMNINKVQEYLKSKEVESYVIRDVPRDRMCLRIYGGKDCDKLKEVLACQDQQ